MAQRYDVSLKTLFLREGDGIIRRLLFGGRIAEHLATEQPQVFNHRADMVARNEDGTVHQVEFQAANESGFNLRMLAYYAYLVRLHGQHVVQTVLYLGPDPPGLEGGYQSPSIDFRYNVINVRDYDAEPLLASPDWADNALALLARGEPEKALATLVERLRAMRPDEQDWATGTLLLLSGILGLEETVNDRLKEVGMINVMENKVIGPLIQQGERKGHSEGKREGMREGKQEGRQDILRELLADKFGTLPAWALQRLKSASADDLSAWAKRILHSTTLEDTLR